MHFPRAALLSSIVSTLLIVACASTPNGSGSGGDEPERASDSASPSGDASRTPPQSKDGGPKADASAPPPSGAPACSTANDCPNWYCDCQSGPPVNTAHCTNGRCEDAATACPRSCKSFGTCWLGTAGGGYKGGSNAGPNDCPPPPPPPPGCGDGSNFSDLGRGCSTNTDCQSGWCIGNGGFMATCSKRCTDESQCPKDWRCSSTSSGTRVCTLGSATDSGPLSTNAGCAEKPTPDTGAGCTDGAQCSSNRCFGTQGNYHCTRRCQSNAQCANGTTCTPDSRGASYCW